MMTRKEAKDAPRRLTLMALLLAGLIGPSAGTAPAQAQERLCERPHQHVSRPLTDLGAASYIRMDGQVTGFSGGLYPGGSNVRPAAHEAAGVAIATQIEPLNGSGRPDPAGGRIVMIAVGMSNAAQEFETFMELAAAEERLNPQLLLINGAQGGQTAEDWTDPQELRWQVVNERLAAAGLAPAQVQVAWVKQVHAGRGDFPKKPQHLQQALTLIARNLKANYPNLRLAYFSSRTRAYRYWEGLSPEPAAFESGFAVKWLIESQIEGHPALNFDPGRGPAVAPYLSWGPYLWIDGANPRSDGLTWLAADLAKDCVHPSPAGRDKVAAMLLAFFTTDSTSAPWFNRTGLPTAATTSPAPTATAAPSLPAPPATPTPRASATPEPSPGPVPPAYR
ncbi:MAG: hypothetical protein ACRDHL_14950, partial [Candidatus Promineifilaceae bacterium]